MHYKRMKRTGVAERPHGNATYPRKRFKLEYTSWRSMLERCYNPNKDNYKWYGGLGITVCDRWRGKDGFKNFLADMGRKPSSLYTLDRKEPSGNYEPSNCRWADSKTQANNKNGKKPF